MCAAVIPMKTWHVVAFAVVLGTGIGFGATRLRVWLAPWDGTPAGVLESQTTPTPSYRQLMSERGPKVSVDAESFEYGMLDSQTPGRHDFLVSNIGTGVLTLTKGEATCKCTKYEIAKTELKPGESTKVTMEWTAKGMDGPFRNRATIHTNDPRRNLVELTVTGRVTTAIKAEPETVDFARVQVGQAATARIRLLGFLPEGFRIEKQEFLEPKYADHFEVKIHRMTSEELANQKPPTFEGMPSLTKDVKCGYTAELTVKPGLPVGTFRQQLRLTTNVKTTPMVTIPIGGLVVSEDIAVVGYGFDRATQVLDLGVIGAEKDTTRTLTLFATGPHSRQIEFQLAEVSPKDVLDVHVGKRVDLTGKPGTQTQLTVRVPKGTRPVNCSGSEESPMGRILLKTNHPTAEAGTLLIRVRLVVAG